MKIKSWIPIFKTGQWKDSQGRIEYWDESRIDEIIESTKKNGANLIPFTELHPKNDLPIWGWFSKDNIRKVKHGEDYIIEVQPTEFADGFIEQIKNNKREQVSVKIMPDMSIKHVGFVPRGAVKTLPAPFEFRANIDEAAEKLVFVPTKEFEDTNYKLSILGDVFAKIRDWFINKYGVEEADKIVTHYEIQAMKSADERLEQLDIFQDNKLSIMYSGGNNMAETDKRVYEQRIAELETDKAILSDKVREFEQTSAKANKRINELEREIAGLRLSIREGSCREFADGLEKNNKILPADKENIVKFMMALEDSAYEFEDNGEKKTRTLADDFREFIESLPARVPEGSIAVKAKANPNVTESREEALVREFMSKNPKATIKEAFVAVSKEHPELFK